MCCVNQPNLNTASEREQYSSSAHSEVHPKAVRSQRIISLILHCRQYASGTCIRPHSNNRWLPASLLFRLRTGLIGCLQIPSFVDIQCHREGLEQQRCHFPKATFSRCSFALNRQTSCVCSSLAIKLYRRRKIAKTTIIGSYDRYLLSPNGRKFFTFPRSRTAFPRGDRLKSHINTKPRRAYQRKWSNPVHLVSPSRH